MERVWITNSRPVYVKRKGAALLKRFGPQAGYHKNLTPRERKRVVRWAKRRGWAVKRGKPVVVEDKVKYPYLAGDLDAGADLLDRLNKVGRDLGKVLWVASGYRSYDEQRALYNDYRAGRGPLAARPGQSNHNRYGAADVHLDGSNIGYSHEARRLMKKYGLSLPVYGENWHVEVGSTWRA